MGFTEVAVAVATTIQIVCVPPKKLAKEHEVQNLSITVREKKRLDIEVEYLTYGTLYGVKPYQELVDEVIHLPTPHGMKTSEFQLKTESDEWFLYEYTVEGNVIIKPIRCEYREVPASE